MSCGALLVSPSASASRSARHAFGAQFVEVRVNAETGEIRVPRVLGVFAVGTVVNPKTARSRFIGGMTMGLGVALLEEGILDPRFGDGSRKQVQAAKRNVKEAQQAARKKRTIAHLPESTRRDLGRQAAKSRQRGGRAGHSLEDRNRQQLYELAQERNIEGRSKMGKWELIEALRRSRWSSRPDRESTRRKP
jgi:hypothetical protein